MAAVRDLLHSKISAQNNKESSEESDYGEDSGGNGLSHEMESDEGVTENELHDNRI